MNFYLKFIIIYFIIKRLNLVLSLSSDLFYLLKGNFTMSLINDSIFRKENGLAKLACLLKCSGIPLCESAAFDTYRSECFLCSSRFHNLNSRSDTGQLEIYLKKVIFNNYL